MKHRPDAQALTSTVRAANRANCHARDNRVNGDRMRPMPTASAIRCAISYLDHSHATEHVSVHYSRGGGGPSWGQWVRSWCLRAWVGSCRRVPACPMASTGADGRSGVLPRWWLRARPR